MFSKTVPFLTKKDMRTYYTHIYHIFPLWLALPCRIKREQQQQKIAIMPRIYYKPEGDIICFVSKVSSPFLCWASSIIEHAVCQIKA